MGGLELAHKINTRTGGLGLAHGWGGTHTGGLGLAHRWAWITTQVGWVYHTGGLGLPHRWAGFTMQMDRN